MGPAVWVHTGRKLLWDVWATQQRRRNHEWPAASVAVPLMECAHVRARRRLAFLRQPAMLLRGRSLSVAFTEVYGIPLCCEEAQLRELLPELDRSP